jgi:hypothetical protein
MLPLDRPLICSLCNRQVTIPSECLAVFVGTFVLEIPMIFLAEYKHFCMKLEVVIATYIIDNGYLVRDE